MASTRYPNPAPAAAMQSPLGGTVPNPDPTVRTVEQLTRDILASREIIEGKIERVEEKVTTRLEGMDKAIEVLAKWRDTLPTLIKDEVSYLKDLHEEKFSSIQQRSEMIVSGIQTQFVERDKRTEQLSLADKTAVAAALQAQKESAASTDESNRIANTKMETNFTKLIEQNQILLQQNTKTLDDKINDIKGRQDRGEGRSAVADPATTEALRLMAMELKDLGKYRDTTSGGAQAHKDYTALIISVGLAVITAVPIIVLLMEKLGGTN